MPDENRRYIPPGYLFIFAVAPVSFSYVRFFTLGPRLEQTFWDIILSGQILGITLIVLLFSLRLVGYRLALLFQISQYFWANVANFTYSYYLSVTMGIYDLGFHYMQFWLSTIIFVNNPFPSIIALQGAILLIQKYNVYMKDPFGRIKLTPINLYRLLAIMFLMRTFENYYIKFTITPWLLYRPFHDFTWFLLLFPTLIVIGMHLLYRRMKLSNEVEVRGDVTTECEADSPLRAGGEVGGQR